MNRYLLLVICITGCDFETFEAPTDKQSREWSSKVIAPVSLDVKPSDFSRVETLRHRHLGAVLRRYIGHSGGQYAALGKDQEALQILDDYLLIVAGVRPESMKRPAERIAFWLNAYTALILKSLAILVSRDGPDAVVSVDDFALFTQQRHGVAGFKITLEELEHLVLRGHPQYPDIANTPADISRALLEQHRLLFPDGRFDPRINFAVSFGARGFPPMPTQVYLADTLETVLEERTKNFINNPNYGVNARGVSVLFQWFRRDFANASGSVSSFIRRYLAPDIPFDAERPLQFDWRVR